MLELTPKEMHDTVFKRYMASRNVKKPPRPLLFLGPSGIGKTVSVRAAAQSIAQETGEQYIDYADFCRLNEEEKADTLRGIELNGNRPFFFVDLMLLSHEPSDFSGIPRDSEVLNTKVTKFIPMEWAALLNRYPGMVFLDEITNVNRDDIRGVAYKIVDERRTGSVVLSPEVQIVAAGNRPDDSSVALPLPAPLLNRMAVYHAAAPTTEDWYKYASTKWPQADSFLLGYLSKIVSSPEGPEASETLRQYATPRTCEAVLEEELGYRIGLGEEVSVDEMNAIAVSNLGGKEGELLTGCWERRKEIIAFLSSEANMASNEKLSPAALWAVGISVGKVVRDVYDSKQSRATGLDATIDGNMGEIIKNIAKHGKEYLVPVYLGMGAFAKGSDPRQSACKAAYAAGKIAFGTNNETQRYGATTKMMAAFQAATPKEYFSGQFRETFASLASTHTNKDGLREFVAVGERLLADQQGDLLRGLTKVKDAMQPIADVVGDSFAEKVMGFDTNANWEKALKDSERLRGMSAGKKATLVDSLTANAAERQKLSGLNS